MSRIALVEPAAPGLHIFSGAALPRLGVVLLGTVLDDMGHTVHVQVEEIGGIDVDTLRGADLVGISAITPTAASCYQLCDRLRREGTPVVLGGPHVTWMADEGLEHADYVIRGEGEAGLPALVEALAGNGRSFASVPGLSWRDEDGRIRHNPVAKPADLNALPRPDLERFGLESRRGVGPRRLVPVQTSRGCPYDCSFCTVHTTFGREVRYRDVARVLDDLEALDGEDIHVFFYDDNFVVSRERTTTLLRGMIERSFRSIWSAQVRADLGRQPEVLDLMARAGCLAVYVGLESVNERALASSRKRQRVFEMGEDIHRIRSAGINVHGMFVLGFDEDDPATLRETVDFACASGITSVQLFILTPLPGSEIWRRLLEQDRIRTRDWSAYDAHHVVYAPRALAPAELQQAQVDGHRRFYRMSRSVGYALRRDLPAARVSLHCNLFAKRWVWQNRRYLNALRALGDSDSREAWSQVFTQVPWA